MMAPFMIQLLNMSMRKVASFATKAAQNEALFIQKQLKHPATTQFLKDKAKMAALTCTVLASGGNPAVMGAAMGGVAADFRKDLAT